MNEIFEQAKKICVTLLSGEKGVIKPELITSSIEKAKMIFPLSSEDAEQLYKYLESLYAIFSDEYRILDDSPPEAWVKNQKAQIRWNFWNRYRMLLENKDYAPDTINKLDNLTDDILDRLIRPGKTRRFDKRGLVVGHVQSGKTGNYIGLICKAADAGYKMIIVLAGIHNGLRSQTQFRIDEGFLGFDTQTTRNFSQATNRIGVGRIDPNLAAHSLTTSALNGDFNRRASEASGINIRGNDPIILVIKKNSSVLRNLLLWLGGRGEAMHDGNRLIRNLPLLLIDDEADNASINISKNQVSAINAGIRALLRLFEQSVYIGYTATPYANIFVKNYEEEEVKGLSMDFDLVRFQLGDDVFPKDFIINIPAPSNYIGPSKIFGIVSSEEIDKDSKPISLFRIVDDYQPQKPAADSEEKEWKKYEEQIGKIREANPKFITDYHRKDDKKPKELPDSLKYAIKCFFLTCAGRRARGQEKDHNSMLIHVSRFIKWQDEIATLVLKEFKFYSRQLEFEQGGLLAELKEIWKEEYIPQTKKIIENNQINDPGITEISWDELLPHIYPAVSKIDVRAVHGDTRIHELTHQNIRPLDYYENRNIGLSVIAIGGNKLSRGLTLEGLSISYYLRASKMYDTLMQMGRWFGYRPGYLDLCRLFTSAELVEWYRHITVATEEMRAEFDRMCDLGKKPRDYGLKVRTHPGVLSITASNKFRYKKIMELSYSGELEETYSFRKDSPKHKENYDQTVEFIRELRTPNGPVNTVAAFEKHYIWQGKKNYNQVINFLSRYHSFQSSFNTGLIAEYIAAQNRHGNLLNWTIAVINNSQAKIEDHIEIANGLNPGLTVRNNDAEDSKDYYEIAKAHIIDPAHEYIDLDDQQIEIARKETLADFAKKRRPKEMVKNPNTLRIKTNRRDEDALLLIYFLNPRPNGRKPAFASCPLVGLAISFPYIDDDEKVEYAVNSQFLKEFNYPDDIDDEEDEEDWKEDLAAEKNDKIGKLLRELENSGNFGAQVNLKIKDGISGVFTDPDSIDELSGRSEVVVPRGSLQMISPSAEKKVFPFIQAQNIQKYFCSQAGYLIVRPQSEHLFVDSHILAAERDGQFFFAAQPGPCVLRNECIGITADEIDHKYLLATLNSSLFGFWARVSEAGGLSSAVRQFPIKRSEAETGISQIVDQVMFLGSNLVSQEMNVMIRYFVNLLDAAVLETYFPEDFRANSYSVVSALMDLPGLKDEPTMERARFLFKQLSNSSGIVEKTLRGMISMDKVKLISGSTKI